MPGKCVFKQLGSSQSTVGSTTPIIIDLITNFVKPSITSVGQERKKCFLDFLLHAWHEGYRQNQAKKELTMSSFGNFY
jgi:hypothetical protein